MQNPLRDGATGQPTGRPASLERSGSSARRRMMRWRPRERCRSSGFGGSGLGTEGLRVGVLKVEALRLGVWGLGCLGRVRYLRG